MLRVGLLPFDATRHHAPDIDYPVDAVLYRQGLFQMHQAPFDADALDPLRRYWQGAMQRAVEGAIPGGATVVVIPGVECRPGSAHSLLGQQRRVAVCHPPLLDRGRMLSAPISANEAEIKEEGPCRTALTSRKAFSRRPS